MPNLTKISQKCFAQKCSSNDWSNGPIRLQYMPLYGQTFHPYSICKSPEVNWLKLVMSYEFLKQNTFFFVFLRPGSNSTGSQKRTLVNTGMQDSRQHSRERERVICFRKILVLFQLFILHQTRTILTLSGLRPCFLVTFFCKLGHVSGKFVFNLYQNVQHRVRYLISMVRKYTARSKLIATLCSRYTTPPPL